MRKLLCILMILGCASGIAQAQPFVNGGFEDGASGWTRDGNVFFSPFTVGSPAPPPSVMPTEGNRFVQLNNGFPGGSDTGCCPDAASIAATLGIDLTGMNATEGSYIYQDFDVTSGSQISFDFNFLTNESLVESFPDFAIASLSNGTGGYWVVANIYDALFPSTIGGYDLMTANNSFSFNAPFTGEARLGFAVFDVGDRIFQSSLYLDNVRVDNVSVPEPATILLLGLGFGGIAALGRKKRQSHIQGLHPFSASKCPDAGRLPIQSGVAD